MLPILEYSNYIVLAVVVVVLALMVMMRTTMIVIGMVQSDDTDYDDNYCSCYSKQDDAQVIPN